MNKGSGTRFAKAAALVGAGALGATILTGVAFAADDTPSTGPGAAASERGPMGHGGPGRFGGFGGPGGREMLHGEATVENPDGGTEQVRTVRGEVTEVSDTSITVRASDGFTQTFAINGDTEVRVGRGDSSSIADVAVGYQAMVAGVVSGDTATARMVGAMTPEDAAEMEQRMAERRAEMDQRDQSEAPTTEG
ncbi:MAG: hypothetical protein H6525_03395 [Actinobacteria bacterium]|nr:hypothetical protein [Actinomycetota bacterium]MCB9411881.1 hypothetical protein [Actinomycetota bacterium]